VVAEIITGLKVHVPHLGCAPRIFRWVVSDFLYKNTTKILALWGRWAASVVPPVIYSGIGFPSRQELCSIIHVPFEVREGHV